MLNIDIKDWFYKIYYNEISLKAFEEWVYNNDSLEGILKSEDYLSLLALDYHKFDSLLELKALIGDIWNKEEEFSLGKVRIIRILQGMIDGSLNVTACCRELVKLYWNGYENVIPIEFVGYESELDPVPVPSEYQLWDPVGLKEALKLEELYKDSIINAAKDFLHELTQE